MYANHLVSSLGLNLFSVDQNAYYCSRSNEVELDFSGSTIALPSSTKPFQINIMSNILPRMSDFLVQFEGTEPRCTQSGECVCFLDHSEASTLSHTVHQSISQKRQYSSYFLP